jgi:hypothetical protein
MRNILVAVLLVFLVFAVSNPVIAGVGEPDINEDYANVGVLIIFDDDALEYPEAPIGSNVSTFCSGVLISETHFLTAAHCIDWISLVPHPYVGVSFSKVSVPIKRETIPVTDWEMHPEYPPGQWVSPGKSPGVGFGTQNDLGIVVLEYYSGEPIALLPYEGYLDDLAARGGLVGQPIVNVGYGVVPTLNGPPGYDPPDGIRRVSTSRFLGLTQNFLKQRQNINAGDAGGSSQGDSGSPKFLPDDQTTILSITSWGGPTSRAFGASVRVDTHEALSFIESVVRPEP